MFVHLQNQRHRKVVVMANQKQHTELYSISAFAGGYRECLQWRQRYTNFQVATQSLTAYEDYRVLANYRRRLARFYTSYAYLRVNGGTWQQTANASLAAGGTIALTGPPAT